MSWVRSLVLILLLVMSFVGFRPVKKAGIHENRL